MVPKLSAPIVLIHGLLGVGRVRMAGVTVTSYFPGIADCLQAAGNRVLIPNLSPTGGIEHRARQLKDFLLRESPKEPVHLLAHSMGGLDARYMISCLGMADHVLSLTTLGTPHRGSSFADWGVNRLARVVKPVFDFLGLPTQGFLDVTTASCQAFNERVKDAPGVRYFSVAGRHDGSFFNPEWLLPYNIVLEAEGPNDGVVSVASASYGEKIEVWDSDHFSMVNWLNPFTLHRIFWRDPRPRYGKLLGRLREEGF